MVAGELWAGDEARKDFRFGGNVAHERGLDLGTQLLLLFRP